MHAVLAVDVGSSSVRATIITDNGAGIGSSRRGRQDGPTAYRFDANSVWRDLRSALADLPPRALDVVDTVCVTAHIGTVFVDDKLETVGPSFGWADTTGADQLRESLGSDLPTVCRVTGRPVLTGGPLAATAALRRRHPAAFARVAQVLSPKDYINARLTGVVATDPTSAAYYGALNVRDLRWEPAICEVAGIDVGMLPNPMSASEVIGVVSAAAARETGLRSGIPVAASGPDGTLGVLFLLGDDLGVVGDVSGTTDVLAQIVDQPDAGQDRPVVVNPYAIPGRWSIGGPTGMTGGALEHWSRILGLAGAVDALERFEDAIGALEPGSRGLGIDPSLTGTRFPRWEPDRTGRLWGQRLFHRPEHVLRAAIEGAAFVVREGIDVLTPPDTGSPEPIRIAGGLTASPLQTQLRADALGRPLLVSSRPDVSLLGAAVVGFLAAGIGDDPGDVRRLLRADDRLVAPKPEDAEEYRRIFVEWKLARESVRAERAEVPVVPGGSGN